MLETLLFVLTVNIVGFLVAFRLKTDKLTDISYAASFASIALYVAYAYRLSAVQWTMVALALLWSLRLGSFLLYRVHVVGKDARFDEMRNSFWKFGRFWVLQGVTAWVVMLPVSLLARTEIVTELRAVTFVWLGVSLLGLTLESVADWQKFRFSRNPKNKGKWIAEGVWKYSRHPNYFGEMLMWYGMWGISTAWLSRNDVFVGLISPLTIVILLVAVSGIPILEKSADKRWGKDKAYQDYKRRTSILVPLPLRKK